MGTREQFLAFQGEVERLRSVCSAGRMSRDELLAQVRRMRLEDPRFGDVWMLSPDGEWFRRAPGATSWIRDMPLELVEPPEGGDPACATLPQLARLVNECRRCPLGALRQRAVPGEGNPNAEIMLIGEGPGFHEDRQGRPFVGAAGKFLDELLALAGYARKDVYIANVVKCRPPNNRDPEPEELSACSAFLERQIALIRPRIILTLGRHSLNRFVPGASISRVHGQPRRVGEFTVVPMFHPAAALHQPRWRETVMEDFRKLPGLLRATAQPRETYRLM